MRRTRKIRMGTGQNLTQFPAAMGYVPEQSELVKRFPHLNGQRIRFSYHQVSGSVKWVVIFEILNEEKKKFRRLHKKPIEGLFVADSPYADINPEAPW